MAFLALAGAFALCVAVQIFLAGLAVFADPRYWARHAGFVHIFELLPLVMGIVAFIGRLPRPLAWQSLALYGLIVLMYFTANIRGAAPAVAALHPVLATVLLGIALRIAGRARQLL